MAVLCRMLNKILFSKLFCPSNNIILCIVPLLDCYKLSLFQLIFENFVQPLPWQIQGRGPGANPPPLIFRPKWDPKGRKNFFWRPGPPYLRVWMTSPPSPLSEGLDPPLHIIRWYFWNDIPRPLKTKSSKLLFKKAIFQFFFLQYWDIS